MTVCTLPFTFSSIICFLLIPARCYAWFPLIVRTTRIKPRPRRSTFLPLAIVLATGAVLFYGTLDMPHFEDPNAPIHKYPNPSYVVRTPQETGVPNVVTAVLAGFRGYDTFGETTVIFTAGLGVLLLLRGRRRKGNAP